MIVQMKKQATETDVNNLIIFLTEKGFNVKDVSSKDIKIFGIIGDTKSFNTSHIEAFQGVYKVVRVQKPYKLASRDFKAENTVIKVKEDIFIGDGSFQIIAGPCSIEEIETMDEVAKSLVKNNVRMIRGGAFKPRTSPYSFQGLEIEGLKIIKEVADKYNLAVVTEIISPDQVKLFKDYVDVYQVGTRNMQNYALLKALGKQTKKPVIIKRGMSATIEEWLLSAEYVLEGGNPNVILCERGIRTFEMYTRNTLDIQAVLAVKELSHLPVIVDPSHSSGKFEMIEKLTLASYVIGADAVIVEVHPNPERAYSDGAQSLKLTKFDNLVLNVNKLKSVF